MDIIHGIGRYARPATVEKLQECVGKGWGEIISRLVVDLEKLGWNGHVQQIKEKFGGLRFYLAEDTEAMHARVLVAESEADKTCEFCGEPGTQRNDSWIKTLCDKCHLTRQTKNASSR